MPLPLSNRLMRTEQAQTTTSFSFPDLMKQGVQQVNSMQQDANSQINELLTGGDVNQAEVFTSVQKADMAFRMLVQVRNKLIAAYEEINSIRV